VTDMIRDIRVIPAMIKARNPFVIACEIKDSASKREKGFQRVIAHDATQPIILLWEYAAVRLLHNDNVKFDVKALVVDHNGYVQQQFTLKSGDAIPVMTSPTKMIIEIPEHLEGVTIELGDRVQYRD